MVQGKHSFISTLVSRCYIVRLVNSWGNNLNQDIIVEKSVAFILPAGELHDIRIGTISKLSTAHFACTLQRISSRICMYVDATRLK